MARGWESKSVEEQIESAESKRPRSSAVLLTPEQRARQRERESLELARTRVLNDLASATNPRRHESLQAALRNLEEKLAALS